MYEQRIRNLFKDSLRSNKRQSRALHKAWITLNTDLIHEFMGKPKDLLKQQEISFDNHQSGKPAEWDDDLHFHKKMTVGGPRGSKVAVSGVIHVKKNRGIGVTYDKGKSHPKIKDKKERELYEKRIKEEISEAIEKNEEEARPFLKRVMDEIDSLSKGQDLKEVTRRKIEAFDNIMDALGISARKKITLRNKNQDLLSLYVEAPSEAYAFDGLHFLINRYSRSYNYYNLPFCTLTFITYSDGKFTLGELTPYSFMRLKTSGYRLTNGAILRALETGEIIEPNMQQ